MSIAKTAFTLVGAFLGYQAFHHFYHAEPTTPEDINKALAAEVDKVNKDLPKMVQQNIRWDKVVAGDMKIEYDFTATVSQVSDLDRPKLSEAIRPQMVAMYCSQLRSFAKHGVSASVHLRDTEHMDLVSVEMNSSDCH